MIPALALRIVLAASVRLITFTVGKVEVLHNAHDGRQGATAEIAEPSLQKSFNVHCRSFTRNYFQS